MEYTKRKWEINTLRGKLPIIREIKMPHQEASHYISVIKCGNRIICRLDFGYGNKKEDEANAHLIAAAPALLEACERDAELANAAITATPTGEYQNKLTEINILRLAAITAAGG